MAVTTAEVPSTSDSIALEMETSYIRTSSESHLLQSDSCWSRLSNYFAGFSNQVKGSVLCLVGILALTPDTLLLRRLQFVSNFAVQFYRNLIFGSTILIFITLVRKKKALKTFKDIGIFGWAAGLLWGASNMLFTAAIQNTAVANVLVIVASNTVFSSIFSYLLLGELIPIRMFVTSAICFGAIALIFSGSVGGGSGDSLGSILAVMASISQGLFFSLIRYKYAKGQDVSDMDILCYNVVAAIGVCVALLLLDTPISSLILFPSVSLALNPNLRDVGGMEILYLVLDGVFVLAGGFGLLVIGPGYIPANEVSLFFLVETILGPVLVFLGGYESPPKFTLYGGICLIFALAMNSVLAIREENRSKILKDKAAAEKRTLESSADSVGESKSAEGSDEDDSISAENPIPETRV